MKIENPKDPESLWLAARVAVVEEHYFDNEQEARAFAKARPYLVVDPPEPKQDPK
jgi:hypothetical protein